MAAFRRRCLVCEELLLLEAFEIQKDGERRTTCRTCRRRGFVPRHYLTRERPSPPGWRYPPTTAQADLLRQHQEHRCAICGTADPALVPDHDHATGLMRGMLCQRCNLGLGSFKDDPERLRGAVAYLKHTPVQALTRQANLRRYSRPRS